MMEKTWKKKKMSKTFRRFMLSFLCVLIFPVVSFIFLFQQNFREIYREKIMQQAEQVLDLVGVDMDGNMEGLRALVDYNKKNNELERVILQNEVANDNIRDILMASMMNYSFLENIFYYHLSDDGQIYSNKGTFLPYYFSKIHGGTSDWDLMVEQLKEIRRAEWVCWGNELNYVVRESNVSWWVFNFDLIEMKRLLGSNNSLTVLCDYQGNELFRTGDVGQGKKCEIVYESSQKNFVIIRKMEEVFFWGELDQWQKKFMIIISIILCMGCGFVVILTYYNELPLKKLLSYSREKNPNVPMELEGLEAIKFVLKSIEEHEIIKSAKYKQSQLLMQMILGQECENERFRKEMFSAGMFLHAKYWRCILATTMDGKEIEKDKIELYIEMMNSENLEIRLTELSSDNTVVMIAGVNSFMEKELDKELMLMAENMEECSDGKIQFFVGEKCAKLCEIHQSYSQAYICRKTAQNNRNENTDNTVIFYKENTIGSKKYKYPKESLEKLYKSLLEADTEQIESINQFLIKILEETKEERFVNIALYYDIINTYGKALARLEKNKEINISVEDILLLEEEKDVVNMINRVYEKYQIYVKQHKKMKVMSGDNIFSSTEGEKLDNEMFINNVKDYIDQNIQSGELSASSVAEHFGLSISYMSHKFKEQTNRNISDYITEKKFSHACVLLEDTDLSVNDIAIMLGYCRTFSFIRKFKQQYEITPGEYRTQVRKEK